MPIPGSPTGIRQVGTEQQMSQVLDEVRMSVDIHAKAVVSLEQDFARGFDPARIVLDIVPVAQPVSWHTAPFGERREKGPVSALHSRCRRRALRRDCDVKGAGRSWRIKPLRPR